MTGKLQRNMAGGPNTAAALDEDDTPDAPESALCAANKSGTGADKTMEHGLQGNIEGNIGVAFANVNPLFDVTN